MYYPSVDVVLLSRSARSKNDGVLRAILAQQAVRIKLHQVVGKALPSDACRWETIVRARNLGKMLGREPWLMFVDDDVELAPGSVGRLVDGLIALPIHAALAADYLGQFPGADSRRHVSMGATLFRRSALNLVRFRWEPGRCECQCCCDDLRSLALGIDYLSGVKARHLKRETDSDLSVSREESTSKSSSGHILAAFDRSHFHKFVDRFLVSLRRAGNREPVTAVTYGLLADDCLHLTHDWGVRVINSAPNGFNPAIRRLRDFQQVIAELPQGAPIAYWDAADVLFQGTLAPLWQLVQHNTKKLLVVAEAPTYAENVVTTAWVASIRDHRARSWAKTLTDGQPGLNSGFAAGTRETLIRYLREADALRHSDAMAGTTDWGDQTAMNLYCYAHPDRYLTIADDWNYCLSGRNRREWVILADGKIVHASNRQTIPVVHGTAKTLESYWRTRAPLRLHLP